MLRFESAGEMFERPDEPGHGAFVHLRHGLSESSAPGLPESFEQREARLGRFDHDASAIFGIAGARDEPILYEAVHERGQRAAAQMHVTVDCTHVDWRVTDDVMKQMKAGWGHPLLDELLPREPDQFVVDFAEALLSGFDLVRNRWLIHFEYRTKYSGRESASIMNRWSWAMCSGRLSG